MIRIIVSHLLLIVLSTITVSCFYGNNSDMLVDDKDITGVTNEKNPYNEELVKLNSVESISKHFIKASLTKCVDEITADQFAIYDDAGISIAIREAKISGECNQVLLTTQAQIEGSYSLYFYSTSIDRVTTAIDLNNSETTRTASTFRFMGSEDDDPESYTAYAISSTQFQIKFSEAMSAMATDTSHYRIQKVNQENGFTDEPLAIESVVFNASMTVATLTLGEDLKFETEAYQVELNSALVVENRHPIDIKMLNLAPWSRIDWQLNSEKQDHLEANDKEYFVVKKPQMTDRQMPLSWVSDSGWSDIEDLTDGSDNTSADIDSNAIEWVEYRLPCWCRISSARVDEDNSGSKNIEQWNIQYWTGDAWFDAFPLEDTPYRGWHEVDFTDVSTDRIRLQVQDDEHIELNELEVYGEAIEIVGIDWYEIKVPVTETLPNADLQFSDPSDDSIISLASVDSSLCFHNNMMVPEKFKSGDTFSFELTAHLGQQFNALCEVEAAGSRYLNPEKLTWLIVGRSEDNEDGPQLVNAFVPNDTTIILQFSEPLSDFFMTHQNFEFLGKDKPNIQNISLSENGTTITLTVDPLPQDGDWEYEIKTHNLVNRSGIPISLQYDTAKTAFTPLQDGWRDDEFRLVSTISQSNTRVLVNFSRRLDAESALNPAHYSIVQTNVNSEVGTVLVTGVQFADENKMSILLSTSSQNEVTYRITATNVYDYHGNAMIQPSGAIYGNAINVINYFDFAGTPPSADELVDSDNDGVSDNEELRGNIVLIELSSGEIIIREVTSDIYLADTDSDGVLDIDEWQYGSDPRSVDTDADSIDDYTELNILFSNPHDQDSDNDGLEDGLEYFYFQTSPILADTDGDKLSDYDELLQLNRDPRIANLPRLGLVVGDVRLQLDETFSYTDEFGQTITQESNSSSTLARSENNAFTQSDGGITEISYGFDVRTGFGNGSFFGGDKGISGGVEITGNFSKSDTSSWQADVTSSIESQRVYENSLSKGQEFSQTSTVLREVSGGRIDVDISLTNTGDVAFTVENIEITVLQRNPMDTSRFLPVATLVSNSELITGTPLAVNLGPFLTDKGPFLFTSREVFPSLIEELMRAPSGLIFKVANFDITDELGRNFSFSNQTARDRTAGITIDYGDADAASHYLVATAGAIDNNKLVDDEFVGGFDPEGAPKGLPIDYILQDILKMSKHKSHLDTINPGLDKILNTLPVGDDVATQDENGYSIIQAGSDGWLQSVPAGDDYISNISDESGIIAGLNKTANSVAQGDDIQLIPVNTTGLSIGSIVINPGENGILDTPALEDDVVEFVSGYETMLSCDASSNKVGDICRVDRDCACQAGDELTDVRCTSLPTPVGSCAGPEQLVRVKNLRNGDFNRKWAVLYTSQIPAAANFGQVTVKPGEDLFLAFLQDLDEDGLFAREEFLSGSTDSAIDAEVQSDFGLAYDKNNPSACFLDGQNLCDGLADSKDSDRDGLGDFFEVRLGWKVAADGGALVNVFSSPRLRDSDGDGLADPVEADLRGYCEFNDPRVNGLCAFQQSSTVLQTDAIGIVAGLNGVAESIPSGDDIAVVALNTPGLEYGTPVILPGTNGVVDSVLTGDDVYEGVNTVTPATDPSRRDTDLDRISDFEELNGYFVGLAIVDGGNGEADSSRNGDDVVKALIGNPVKSGGIVLLPGENGVIDSVPGGDDVLRAATRVRTDPLRRDTDDDTVIDGFEQTLGSNPTIADGSDFRDSDLDGLTDSEEAELGWIVTVNNEPTLVKSSPSLPDTDFDGLPDIVERDLRTDPNKVDTDNDGLSDFDELASFEQYVSLASQYPNVEINGSASARYGTDPLKADTDGDTLSDKFEATEGYRLLVPGATDLRHIFTSPLSKDTDLDGVDDQDEMYVTDASSADTDGDGRSDGLERASGSDPLVPDVAIKIEIQRIIATEITGDGANGVAEMTWWFTTQGPKDTDPVLLHNTSRARPQSNYIWAYDPPISDNRCYEYLMTPNFDYYLTTVNSARTIVLKEGQSFVLNGMIGEIDDISTDCGHSPNYIPSSITDGQNCISYISKVFSFNDFIGGNSGEILKAEAKDACTIEVQYLIETL